MNRISLLNRQRFFCESFPDGFWKQFLYNLPMSKHLYIFVHGLSGWGSYDPVYRVVPYWGMRNGDLMEMLRRQGYDCYAASVSPTGSAWDRACELYAQLAGTVTDYGAAHSRKNRHARFGRDFQKDPLIPEWNEETRLVLIGHSFGGTTVRLLAELMANGDAAERQDEGECSPLFRGGMRERIHSVVTLATPMNGSTAYDIFEDPDYDRNAVRATMKNRFFGSILSMGLSSDMSGRAEEDWAAYDMHIDHALELNRKMMPIPNVYYFSVPCSCTEKQPDGTWRATEEMSPLLVTRSNLIGAYSGTTPGGFEIDESWRENDGLVNTISASAPLGAPSMPWKKGAALKGVWNVLPVYHGDHMALQGGLASRQEILGFYLGLLGEIERLH